MTDSRYPLEVANVVRKQTFYVNSKLSLANLNPSSPKEFEPPLMTFGHFSRYEFCIINEDRKAATANINLTDIRGVIRRSRYLLNKHYDAETSQKSAANVSPAYSVRIASGRLAGKTPAEILAEGIENQQALEDQKKFLAAHLDKYPKNKIQIDAIQQALDMARNGQLNAASVVRNDNRKLYVAAMRPLTRRKVPSDILARYPQNVQNIVSFVYEILIEWSLGMQGYPVTVSIINYYAPVEKRPDGTLNVHKSELDRASALKNSMKLSADEWMDTIDSIDSDIRRFQMLYASKCYKAAMEAENANRNARVPEQREASYQPQNQPSERTPYANVQQPPMQQTVEYRTAPEAQNAVSATDMLAAEVQATADRLNISTDDLPF